MYTVVLETYFTAVHCTHVPTERGKDKRVSAPASSCKAGSLGFQIFKSSDNGLNFKP